VPQPTNHKTMAIILGAVAGFLLLGCVCTGGITAVWLLSPGVHPPGKGAVVNNGAQRTTVTGYFLEARAGADGKTTVYLSSQPPQPPRIMGIEEMHAELQAAAMVPVIECVFDSRVNADGLPAGHRMVIDGVASGPPMAVVLHHARILQR
jgi:hypothetical protein